MIDTVIFDLFGTLVYLKRNTRPYLQLCRDLGVVRRLRESLLVDAPTLPKFCDYLGHDHPDEIVSMQRELEADVASTSLFDDSIAVLEYLRKREIRIGLVSNLASPYKSGVFEFGLNDLIDVSVFSCDVGIAKPANEIYELALSRLDAKAETTLMIGDSRRCDVDGPMASGIRGLLLDRSSRSSNDSVLRTLMEVESFVCR